MLTETIMAIVFAGHFSAAAVLPFLAWQQAYSEDTRLTKALQGAHFDLQNN
jgi:hypothetical protein